MSIPYVCSACRSASLCKVIRVKQKAIRLISTNANRSQGAETHPHNHAATAAGREQQIGSHGTTAVMGRYSRQELMPEQLLTQLSQADVRDHRSRQPSRQADRNSNPFLIPTETRMVVDEISRAFDAVDRPRTWRLLQRLASMYADYSPRTRKAFLNLANISRTYASLMHQATDTWLDSLRTGRLAPGMPTPYQMLLLLHRAYVHRALFYRPVMAQIAQGLLQLQAQGGEGHEEGVRKGVKELMGIWRLCIGGNLAHQSFGEVHSDAKRRAFASVAEAENDWTFLPSATVFSSWQTRKSDTTFEQMLALLVPEGRQSLRPGRQSEEVRNDFASAALITLDLLRNVECTLSDGETIPYSKHLPFTPFVELLETMLAMSPNPRVPPLLHKLLITVGDPNWLKHLQTVLARIGYDAASISAARIKQAEASPPLMASADPQGDRDTAREALVSEMDNESKHHTNLSPKPEAERFAERQIERLVRAMKGQNVARLAPIMNDVYRYSAEQKEGEQLPLTLYEHMLLVSLSLRDTKTAVEIWHHMQQIGIKPTTKTYTAMMRGAQNARDIQGMETFFQRMRQAGLQPDAYTWTVRIFALLKLRNVKVGMEALNEMSREWLAAARAKAASEDTSAPKKQAVARLGAAELLQKFPGPIDGVPRPNLEIMNAAMSALAAVRPEEVSRVLRWGRSFGVEPDLSTFNTLISVAMKGKKAEDAFVVLRQMQERGVQADATTWTVLLTSLFDSGFFDQMSHDAQQKYILDFIDALSNQDNGLPGLNSMGYALIMDRLLKQYENHIAAAAVFAHMLSHGHKPTAHIYTILMTSYFDRQPHPDFSAIDHLWRQIQDQGHGFMAAVDVVFYDRMIEGYARHHHLVGLRPMEEFLRKCRASGKKPGWKAMESVARVYAGRQMWGRLRTLVDDARLAMKDQVWRISKSGEREFWDFIHSTGLLREEGYVTRDDFKRDRPVGSPLLRAEEAYARTKAGRMS